MWPGSKYTSRQDYHFTEASFVLDMYMLWLKFFLGLMFFQLVSILFAIVPDYGNEYTTKENKN